MLHTFCTCRIKMILPWQRTLLLQHLQVCCVWDWIWPRHQWHCDQECSYQARVLVAECILCLYWSYEFTKICTQRIGYLAGCQGCFNTSSNTTSSANISTDIDAINPRNTTSTTTSSSFDDTSGLLLCSKKNLRSVDLWLQRMLQSWIGSELQSACHSALSHNNCNIFRLHKKYQDILLFGLSSDQAFVYLQISEFYCKQDENMEKGIDYHTNPNNDLHEGMNNSSSSSSSSTSTDEDIHSTNRKNISKVLIVQPRLRWSKTILGIILHQRLQNQN